MISQTLTAVIHKEGDLYVAECPEIGTVSQGADFTEAVANLKEATELYMEEAKQSPCGRSVITTFEAVVNA
ncbi:MAG: type II toxin-antitoxin system HicB family antitoxin [Synergistaceae bacterium]|jgi:predicted RNase H-like HicB family nuclease|nr:type II toxin-antitoxin system HicB family antitoxin [Synergistaceae bacterium]